MLSVVSWLWRSRPGYSKRFDAQRVNVTRALVEAHCSLEHEFVCVTDQPDAEFDPRVRVVPLWDDYADLAGAWPLGPSCWRRLRIFAPEAHDLLGVKPESTIVSIDLDSVPCGPLAPLWDGGHDFVGWYASPRAPCCGSMFLHRLGTLPQIWTDFDYDDSRAEARRLGFTGTDQSWVACHVAGKYPVWTKDDGVYSFKKDIVTRSTGLPSDARIVFFHGQPDAWDADVRVAYPWLARCYPLEVKHGDRYGLQGAV